VATDEKKRENREFLVVGWDAEAPLLRSVQGHRTSAWVDHADGDAVVEDDPRFGGTKLPAFEPGLGDRGEEGEPGLAEKVAPLAGHAIPVVDDGLDDPDALGAEPSLDLDGEGRVAFHGDDVPLAGGAESSRAKEKRP